PDREAGGADRGSVVTEGPIRDRHPSSVEDRPLEDLRCLCRPQALARHLFYGDPGLVRTAHRVRQWEPCDGTALGTRDLDAAREEGGRRERPSRVVDGE